MRKYNWKKILIQAVWILTGAGTIVLLGAAMQKKNQKACADVAIEITGVEKHMFIDEKDVLDMLNVAGRVEGSKVAGLNLRAMETMVEKNPWVKNAEMFIDNRQVLQVRIEERQPVARVFTLEGTSFYVDSTGMRLPLSEKISARVPVFTGFASDQLALAKPDSAVLHNIVQVGQHILADSFWMAQVAQVDITPQATFEIIPVIGDHVVILGNADHLDNKFNRLYTFYKQAWLQNGINTYESLNVQYSNQVVAIRKGTAKARIDSARAKEIMDGMLVQQQASVDSGSVVHAAVIPVVKNTKDSISSNLKTTIKLKAQPVNTTKQNSVSTTNNKITIKALSNGKKTAAVEKKKQPVGKSKPKATMKKG